MTLACIYIFVIRASREFPRVITAECTYRAIKPLTSLMMGDDGGGVGGRRGTESNFFYAASTISPRSTTISVPPHALPLYGGITRSDSRSGLFRRANFVVPLCPGG